MSPRPGDREPVLVASARTPVGRLGGMFRHVEAVDLGAAAVAEALSRAGDIRPEQVLLGNVVQAGNGQNPARIAAARAGVEPIVPAVTLNDVCLASMSATAWAAAQIRHGELSAAVVGGFESMTRAPHGVRTRVAPRVGDADLVDLLVHDGLWCGLTEQGMGALSDAENARLGVSRADQDEFAVRSHRCAHAAQTSGTLAEEIVGVAGVPSTADEGVRPDSGPAQLARLAPAFTPSGTITAANASQMSDAGAAGVVTSAARARAAGFRTAVQLVDRAVVAGPDATLHLKPARAARALLERNGLAAADVELWEINEAFAGVVLATVRDLGIDLATVNTCGGAIALGHPLGASGFRLLSTLAHRLVRGDAELAVAAICGGGGQGEALLLRRAELG